MPDPPECAPRTPVEQLLATRGRALTGYAYLLTGDLASAVETVRPTALIGVSTSPGAFSETIIARMAAMKIVAVPQPNFIYELGDSYIRNFTEEQLACSYPGRTWFDRGIVAVGSSDVPVVDCDVLRNLSSAVTRLTATGLRMGPGQGVTIEEALVMFTRHGAFASFEEGSKGTISPGKLADLVVLSGDPRAVAAEELPRLSVEMTVVDGRVAYERTG